MKKKGKWIIGLILIVLLILAGYLGYVLLSYDRLPDQLTLEVERNGRQSYFDEEQPLETGVFYDIMTYNIGFGAYRPEYSFFMDGGKSSRAKDEESVIAGVCGMGEIVNSIDPDFVLLQEVDTDGTRSYHVNELELMNEFVKGYYYVYAQNYDSPYLCYPLLEPHGANRSGIVTYSRNQITTAKRRSLPISDSLSRLVDLDRCYSVSKMPVGDTGKMLCIYNVHLSAYSTSEVREGQLNMLTADMVADYKAGNYVICGGDFNHNLKAEVQEKVPDWAAQFPREMIPEGFQLAIDEAPAENITHNSCRNANEPYEAGHTFTVTLDGFIVSDNISVNYYANLDWQYEYSDHDPVVMQFLMK